MYRISVAAFVAAAGTLAGLFAWHQAPTPAPQAPQAPTVAFKETKTSAPQLPLTRVVLFTSGVGFFQREGVVEGNARIDLAFNVRDVNDLLKSLVLQDEGGGQISAVSYDSHDPVDKTLKSFALDLTGNPGFGQLLGQARGEMIDVEWQGQTLKGKLVGVERQKQPAGKDTLVEVELLNILTADGLRSLPLAQVQRVRFVNAWLDSEFNRALDLLATSHNTQKRTVTLHFNGEGKRLVRIGYVLENPIWKTSYRLVLDQTKPPFLQGWAIVDNVTDEDWNNVNMTLVAGRPISFRMDLYEPLYVPRPLVELEQFAGLRPPKYSGPVDAQFEAAKAAEMGRKLMQDKAAAAPGAAGKGGFGAAPVPKEAKFDITQGVAPGVMAQELGDYFLYQIKQPVSVPRQKSSLVPLINQNVQGTRVSIYNAAVLARHPLLGLKFKNATSLHLMQGPVTVFEGNSYAGDGLFPDLQPNEERLLSYAVDLGVEVDPVGRSVPEQLTTLKIVKGILYLTYKERQSKVYVIKNRTEHPRTVLLEQPFRADWKLTTPEHATERSRDFYRFQVAVPPGQTVSQEVVEEQPRVSQVILTTSDDQAIRVYLTSPVITPKVKAALEQAIALKMKLGETLRAIGQAERDMEALVKDQARLRANLERVPANSLPYQRYMKKLDEQETQIEQLQEHVRGLRRQEEEQRKAYETFLLNLNVE
jgi:hypothetical protein